MIKIEFTCKTCGKITEITVDDVEEKMVVPVCDACYQKFLSLKSKRVKAFNKKIIAVYKEYGIPVDTFNADEEFSDLKE